MIANTIFALTIGVWFLAGCVSTTVGPQSSRLPVPTGELSTPAPATSQSPTPGPELIAVEGEDVPPHVLDDISDALRAGAPAICDALRVACDFSVTVEVFADQTAFDREVMNPDMRGYFALSGDGRIQMVSPANSGRDELTYEDGVAVAVHEFVHLALDQIDPELPDWLEEGTAVYLSPHEVYDRVCREQLAGVDLPTLSDLRAHYSDVPAPDLFAYTLVASIVATDGLDGLNALLRTPDELEQALGRSAADVEHGWQEFTQSGCVPQQ